MNSSFCQRTQALGRNIRHVKELTFNSDELAYYYNCVQTFEELKEQSDDAPGPRPSWYPARDPITCEFVALPPMTRLTHLDFYFTRFLEIKLPSASEPQLALAQNCWLISHNPHLTNLHIHSLPITASCNCRLLFRTIADLRGLKYLNVSIACHLNRGFQLGLDLLNCLSPSIQSFNFGHMELGDTREEQDNSETGDGGSSRELVVVPRRQGLLTELLELRLWRTTDETTAADILSVFAQCPNIQKLVIGDINGHYNVQDIGGFIGRQCPHINSLSYYSVESEELDSLPYRIMQELPPQQIIDFIDMGEFSDLSFPTANLTIVKHSTTLRTLSFSRINGGFRRISVGAIFDECMNLTKLHMGGYGGGVYIDLADAQGSPWRCTKLRSLTISVSGCVLPPVDAESLPYYDRPAPIALTHAETDLLSQLEKLYIQIGRLTELRDLSITIVKFDGQGEVDETSWSWNDILAVPHSFPAMLSLGDPWQGRPGYLGHLAGLSKLENFKGSVRADTKENKKTMEWKECVWINEHWPQLRLAYFFHFNEDISAPFTWLQEQRKYGRGRLMLSWTTKK
ncbi:hypothetical protein KI688_004962 [Linnemannia hyalina]|uniref:F-box domain-containing protein n=1 Tax=Linnemannia hyalina TaxID=64524 RepID=A0A9P7XLE9_9FUNG|nr:hypothetical protein KI688_004962 [Linnemannia hyalina]